tara:strand:- start:49619 stop:49906 length:288 start_codon:yes stop_codon:yes gene_type:complete
MFKRRPLKILYYLQERLKKENNNTLRMLSTYQAYLKNEASEEDIIEANLQLNELLKDLSLGLLSSLPFSPITIPFLAKIAKKYDVDIYPEWFKKD